MIHQTYTIFSRIKIYVDDHGKFYCDELWEKDLTEHAAYIERLFLCCPVAAIGGSAGRLRPVPWLKPSQVYALSGRSGWVSELRSLIPHLRTIAKAARHSDLVHSGGAGWPFPLSYYLLLIRIFYSFKWIFVVESTFWMSTDDRNVSLYKRLKSAFNTCMIRCCTRYADATIFTQSWYRQYFRGAEAKSLIGPATWIDADHVITHAEHDAISLSAAGPARFLFPARLIADKGVATVLDALGILGAAPPSGMAPIRFDVIGTGALLDACRTFEREGRGGPLVAFRVLDPVPYGRPFFDILKTYDAIVIANRQAEQPRIIFDALSQGVPCVTTRTTGTVDLIVEGENGFFFEIDDGAGLAGLLAGLSTGRARLRAMGRRAIDQVRGRTHRSMHAERERFLKAVLSL